MALIDYGALLKVNGKFINKNKNLFMTQTDMGYKPKKDIDRYVIAGDEDFLLSFYKCSCYIYHNEKLIGWTHHSPFISETIYNGDNLPNVKIEHLDKENRIPYVVADSWSEFMLCRGILLNNEEEIKISKSKHPKMYKKYLRYLDSIKRCNRNNQYYTQRWKATWDYKDNHYEVIFGVGIDPNEKVWNNIKYDGYDFTDIERNIIDKWFKGENS